MSWLNGRPLTYATYGWVRDHILEITELGYTQQSKDRVWVVLCFDVWSENSLYGNPIYSCGDHGSYDLWEDELCFSSRHAAQVHADERNAAIRAHSNEPDVDIWMTANLGDLDRFDNAYLAGRGLITRGKFRGSDRALHARARFWAEWLENPQLKPDINEESA